MKEPYRALKAVEQALCNDYLKTASYSESAERSYGHFNVLQASAFLKTDRAINYLKVMREKMNAGVAVTYNWKLETLAEIVDGTKGDEPRTAISAIGEMNRMQGHHAPTSTVVMNISQDDYIKQVNAVAQRIMAEEKKNKLAYEGEFIDESEREKM